MKGMNQVIQYPKYLDAVRYAIDTHSKVLEGKGKVTGRKFAKLIREKYDQANPINQNAAELAEAYIDNIEITPGNTIRWQFR